MPKVLPRAVLESSEVAAAMTVAASTGPLEAALFAWMYEFGARASEPGLQLVDDVDLRLKRAKAFHLKQSNQKPWPAVRQQAEWHALYPFCLAHMPAWLKMRPSMIIAQEQADYLFPSRVPGRCYVCQCKGKHPILRREAGTGVRSPGAIVPCVQCSGTGKRWGLSRFEAYAIVTSILEEAGVPKGYRHPHVLRHSVITHLLEGGLAPTAIQDRVGHSTLEMTLSYARATKRAGAEAVAALTKAGVYG
jgi:integrase